MRTPAGLQAQGKVLWKKIIGEFGAWDDTGLHGGVSLEYDFCVKRRRRVRSLPFEMTTKGWPALAERFSGPDRGEPFST